MFRSRDKGLSRGIASNREKTLRMPLTDMKVLSPQVAVTLSVSFRYLQLEW